VLGAQGYCKIDTLVLDKEQIMFVNAAIEGAEEGTQHLPWLLEMQLPPNKDAPHGPGEADKTDQAAAGLVEEAASAADSAHFEEELSLVIRLNKKRGADALNEDDLTAEEISPRRNPSKIISRAQWRKPAKRLKASRGVVDIEDQMGRVRRRPTARISKLQRYPASRL
jgi:hypothetical protein